MSEYYSEFGVFNNGSIRITPSFKSDETRYLLALQLESSKWTSQLQHIASPSAGVNIYRGLCEYKTSGYNRWSGVHTLTVNESPSIPVLTLHTSYLSNEMNRNQYQYTANSSLSRTMHNSSNDGSDGTTSMILNTSHIESFLNPSTTTTLHGKERREEGKVMHLYRDDLTKGDYSCMLLRSQPRTALARDAQPNTASASATATTSSGGNQSGTGKGHPPPSGGHSSTPNKHHRRLIEEINTQRERDVYTSINMTPLSLTALASMNVNDITNSPVVKAYNSYPVPTPDRGAMGGVSGGGEGLNTLELLEKVTEKEKMEKELLEISSSNKGGRHDSIDKNDKREQREVYHTSIDGGIGLAGMTSLGAQSSRGYVGEPGGRGAMGGVSGGRQEAMRGECAITPEPFKPSKEEQQRERDVAFHLIQSTKEAGADPGLNHRGTHRSPDSYTTSMSLRHLPPSVLMGTSSSVDITTNGSNASTDRGAADLDAQKRDFSLIHPYDPSAYPVSTPGPGGGVNTFPPPTPTTNALTYTNITSTEALTREEVLYGTDPGSSSHNGYYGFESVQRAQIDLNSTRFYHDSGVIIEDGSSTIGGAVYMNNSYTPVMHLTQPPGSARALLQEVEACALERDKKRRQLIAREIEECKQAMEVSIHCAFKVDKEQYEELMAMSGREAVECMGRYRKGGRQREVGGGKVEDNGGTITGDDKDQERVEMKREDKDGNTIIVGDSEQKENGVNDNDAKDDGTSIRDDQHEGAQPGYDSDTIENFYAFANHQRLKERYRQQSINETGRVPTRVGDLVAVLAEGYSAFTSQYHKDRAAYGGGGGSGDREGKCDEKGDVAGSPPSAKGRSPSPSSFSRSAMRSGGDGGAFTLPLDLLRKGHNGTSNGSTSNGTSNGSNDNGSDEYDFANNAKEITIILNRTHHQRMAPQEPTHHHTHKDAHPGENHELDTYTHAHMQRVVQEQRNHHHWHDFHKQGEPHYLSSTIASEAAGVSLAAKERVHHEIEREEAKRYNHHKHDEGLLFHSNETGGAHGGHSDPGHGAHHRTSTSPESRHRSPSVDSKHSTSTNTSKSSSIVKRKIGASSVISANSHHSNVGKASHHSLHSKSSTTSAHKHKKSSGGQLKGRTVGAAKRVGRGNSGLESDLVALLEMNSDEEREQEQEESGEMRVREGGGGRERSGSVSTSATGRERTSSIASHTSQASTHHSHRSTAHSTAHSTAASDHTSHSTAHSTAHSHASKGGKHSHAGSISNGGGTAGGSGGVIIVDNDHLGLYDDTTTTTVASTHDASATGVLGSTLLGGGAEGGDASPGSRARSSSTGNGNGNGSTILTSTGTVGGDGSLAALVGELVHDAGLDKEEKVGDDNDDNGSNGSNGNNGSNMIHHNDENGQLQGGVKGAGVGGDDGNSSGSVSSLGIDGADMASTGQLIANDVHNEFMSRPHDYKSPYKGDGREWGGGRGGRDGGRMSTASHMRNTTKSNYNSPLSPYTPGSGGHNHTHKSYALHKARSPAGVPSPGRFGESSLRKNGKDGNGYYLGISATLLHGKHSSSSPPHSHHRSYANNHNNNDDNNITSFDAIHTGHHPHHDHPFHGHHDLGYLAPTAASVYNSIPLSTFNQVQTMLQEEGVKRAQGQAERISLAAAGKRAHKIHRDLQREIWNNSGVNRSTVSSGARESRREGKRESGGSMIKKAISNRLRSGTDVSSNTNTTLKSLFGINSGISRASSRASGRRSSAGTSSSRGSGASVVSVANSGKSSKSATSTSIKSKGGSNKGR